MKPYTSIILVLVLIGLGGVADTHPHHDKHHHKHHHKHGYVPIMTLTLCPSKLDFLCLTHVYEKMLEYRANVTVVIDSLKFRIEERIDAFNVARLAAQDTWQGYVSDAVSFLIARIVVRGQGNPTAPASFRDCLHQERTAINSFQDSLLDMIDECVANNKLNETASDSAVSNLNSTAMAEADKICDCVKDITTCSTKKQKEAAKLCATTAVSALSIEMVSSKADIIYKSFDDLATKTNTELLACFSDARIAPERTVILNAINACPT